MVVHIQILQNESKLWSFLGFVSSIVGLICYALSSSFKHLFGEWNHLKLFLYIMMSLIICSIVLFVNKIQVSRSFIVKSHLGFLVLMLTSLYSYFYDKAVNGKPDALSIVSYTAFAFMSLCFSRKMNLGFEVGLFNFFLGFLTIQLMEISLIFAFVAAILCYSLIICRCYSDSQIEILPSSTEDCVSVRIDSTNGETQPSPISGELTAGNNQQISLSFQYEPTRQGSVSGESISGNSNQQNREEEKSLSNVSVQDETAEQEIVTSENKVVTVEKQISSSWNQSHPQYSQLTRRGAAQVATAASLSRYESHKRRDWNVFMQYLRNQKPPLTLAQCSGAHVIEFLKYLDQFGKTKVHVTGCPYFGHPNPPAPCACPLKQAWGSLNLLNGRLRAAYEENGGRPESNPFGQIAVRVYLREVMEGQAKARGIPYEKKKRKRTAITTTTMVSSAATSSGADVATSGGGDVIVTAAATKASTTSTATAK